MRFSFNRDKLFGAYDQMLEEDLVIPENTNRIAANITVNMIILKVCCVIT